MAPARALTTLPTKPARHKTHNTKQVGDLVFEGDGLAKRGVILRHLLMPGLLSEGREIMKWTAEALGRDTFVNIMPQYWPAGPLLATGEQRSRCGWVGREGSKGKGREGAAGGALLPARRAGEQGMGQWLPRIS
jgi:hypothetical protein